MDFLSSVYIYVHININILNLLHLKNLFSPIIILLLGHQLEKPQPLKE